MSPDKFNNSSRVAPGRPGIPPAWSDSAKTGVGTALDRGSRVWFTMAGGIVTELFFPQIDTAAVRDLQFIVADGNGFFSDQRRDAECEVSEAKRGVPAYVMKNKCKHGCYVLDQELVADPQRSAFLIRVSLAPMKIENPLLYVLLAPHLANRGSGNDAWVGEFKGRAMLFAQRNGVDGPSVLALGCSIPFRKLSVGYVGQSDGWQDVHRNGRMLWEYDAAPDGNVALTAELDTTKGLTFLLAIGFGTTVAAAGHHVQAGLIDGFDLALEKYGQQWEEWRQGLAIAGAGDCGSDRMAEISAVMLRCHEAKEFSGGMVASLGTPWGESHGDSDYGYHMVWTRDLIESIGGLMAAGAHNPARRVLTYLHATQEADGHWPQNMFVDGRPHWTQIQMDEVGFPILLAFAAERETPLDKRELAAFWPTVHRAACYIIGNGPATHLDRWEEFAGYSVFTLAVEISALLAAADYAAQIGEAEFARQARAVAGQWNANIEEWTYLTGTALAKKLNIEGYYGFVIPEQPADRPPADRPFSAPNWSGEGQPLTGEIISTDALALVRFGLRSPHDARILNTLKAIDATLKVETPFGPCWRRFTGDAYGESAAGEPFSDDNQGIGRAWPLLTGERAHYELAAGNRAEAIRLMHTMEAFANASGLIPEQVWDTLDIPERKLFRGRPTGSAMPLVWAHAEYLKLRRSLRDNRVFDMPPTCLFSAEWNRDTDCSPPR